MKSFLKTYCFFFSANEWIEVLKKFGKSFVNQFDNKELIYKNIRHQNPKECMTINQSVRTKELRAKS